MLARRRLRAGLRGRRAGSDVRSRVDAGRFGGGQRDANAGADGDGCARAHCDRRSREYAPAYADGSCYKHAGTHAYGDVRAHKYARTCADGDVRSHKHARTYGDVRAHAYAHSYKHARTVAHRDARSHKHPRTCADGDARAREYARSHNRANIQARIFQQPRRAKPLYRANRD